MRRCLLSTRIADLRRTCFRTFAARSAVAVSSPCASDDHAIPFVDCHVHLDMIASRVHKDQANSGDLPLSDKPLLNFATFANENFNSFSKRGQFDGCVTVACNPQEFQTVDWILSQPFARQFNIRAAFGVHPHNAACWNTEVALQLKTVIEKHRTHGTCVAVRECGLDYHMKPGSHELLWNKRTQREVFAAQCELACELDMPLVVHTRMAEEDTLAVMRHHLDATKQRIHIHCFTDTRAFSDVVLKEFPNAYFGFTGCVTFKSKRTDDLRAVVASIPTSRILLETDGPFMAPVPHRGTVAHCGHIPLIAAEIARVHKVDIEHVLTQCRANTRAMYGF